MDITKAHTDSEAPQPFRGIKPFRYSDRDIFAGRNWEKEQLLNLVSLYRGILLFGQSGFGKSSLINAALAPKLLEYDYSPEVMRVSPSYNGTFIIYRIKEQEDQQVYLPSIFDDLNSDNKPQISVSFAAFRERVLSLRPKGAADETDTATKPPLRLTLVDEIHYSEALADDASPIPVFIFDQFEELITLFEEMGGTTTDGELTPADRRKFQKDIIELFREVYYNRSLRMKFIFVFREDYLAKFSRLFMAIPDLKDHTLRIKSIPCQDIHQIVACPFTGENLGRFPNPFTESFMVALEAKLNAHFDDDYAVLTDVQIVCEFLYDLPPQERMAFLEHTSIKDIIRQSYENALSRLPAADRTVATEILQILVLNENTRNIFHKHAISEALIEQGLSVNNLNLILDRLEHETRLVRSERRSGGVYYEINSESIIPTLNKMKVVREQSLLAEGLRTKNKKRTVVLVMLLVLAFTSFGFWYQHRQSQDNRAQLYMIAAKNAANPTLAYLIAKDAFAHPPDILRNYLNGFENRPPDFYLTGMFADGYGKVGYDNKGRINVVQRDAVLYYGPKGIIFEKQRFKDIDYVYFAFPESGLLVGRPVDGGGICLVDMETGRATRYAAAPGHGPSNSMAPDRNSFILAGNLYHVGTAQPVDSLTAFGQKLHKAVFSRDGKSIIGQTQYGDFYRFSSNGKMEGFIGNTGNGFTDFCIAPDGHSLYVVGKDNKPGKFPIPARLPKGHQSSSKTHADYYTAYYDADEYGNVGERIAISPDGKHFLIAHSNEVELSDGNGNMRTLITSESRITNAIFSPDGKNILASTLSGKVYIWKKGEISALYRSKELQIYSPLDYAKTGLTDYTAEKVYGNPDSSIELLRQILTYSMALPNVNEHPGDKDYDNLIRTALRDISRMYKKLMVKKRLSKLSKLQRRQAMLKYARFEIDSISLSSTDNDSIMRIKGLLITQHLREKAFDDEQSDKEIILDLAQGYKLVAKNLVPDYAKAARILKNGISKIEKAIVGTPYDAAIRHELSPLYDTLSHYSIYSGHYEDAVVFARKGLYYDNTNKWINANLAMGLLLQDHYTEARKIYTTNPDLKAYFIEDIKAWEKAKIVQPGTASHNEVLKIKEILRKL
ncbi:hypothetical protein HYN48_07240 [Flavobacterium magnum]|uniref:Novel STAND NTPase 1 domain-containing protein n=1 Tax=Flavobacterium magnum TaxID=2162713 RepID=A0A2S0RD69_9FLAO|nr:NACHT and WD repeat domain-containing protein [Flavobacterium magnum]AWA29887.1 hypothetical protein HYN48_07240 [Flavobacterium magnum]